MAPGMESPDTSDSEIEFLGSNEKGKRAYDNLADDESFPGLSEGPSKSRRVTPDIHNHATQPQRAPKTFTIPSRPGISSDRSPNIRRFPSQNAGPARPRNHQSNPLGISSVALHGRPSTAGPSLPSIQGSRQEQAGVIDLTDDVAGAELGLGMGPADIAEQQRMLNMYAQQLHQKREDEKLANYLREQSDEPTSSEDTQMRDTFDLPQPDQTYRPATQPPQSSAFHPPIQGPQVPGQRQQWGGVGDDRSAFNIPPIPGSYADINDPWSTPDRDIRDDRSAFRTPTMPGSYVDADDPWSSSRPANDTTSRDVFGGFNSTPGSGQVYPQGQNLSNPSGAWPTIITPPFGAPAAQFGGLPLNTPLNTSRPHHFAPMQGGSAGIRSRPGTISQGRSLSSLIARTAHHANYDWLNNDGGMGSALPARAAQALGDLDQSAVSQEEIRDLVANIAADEDMAAEDRQGTPEALKSTLYEHQKVALTWMMKMEDDKKKKGGILADDMGLGKTISTLALMVSRPAPPPKERSDPHVKTNLIVGPLSLIRQWASEIRTKLKATHVLSVFIAHGHKKDYKFLSGYDVILTTYDSICSEMKKRDKLTEDEELKPREQRDPDKLERELLATCPITGPQSRWYRIVCDEAQQIKNPLARRSIAMWGLKAEYRWCLTGTPIMNKVEELSPIVKFLRIKPYHDLSAFRKDFDSLDDKKARTQVQLGKRKAMEKLQILLKAIMLRRTKQSKVDGKPIIELPSKTQHDVFVDLSDDEKAFYQNLAEQSRKEVKRYEKLGLVGKNYASILAKLLKLRQACNHPMLHLFDADAASGIDQGDAATPAMVRTLLPSAVQRIKESEDFECPICCDIVQSPVFVLRCGHEFCKECFDQFLDSQARDNPNPGPITSVSCPKCRGPIHNTRVVTYAAFQAEFQPEKLPKKESDDEDSDAEVDSEEGGPSKTGKSGKGKGPEEGINVDKLRALRKRATRGKAARLQYRRQLSEHWESSSKIEKCCELLNSFKATGEKAIVFSQWTLMLDLVEIALDRDVEVRHVRYDGAMTATARHEAAEEFMGDPEVRVILVSLKSGNAGLNLTAASRVIILDPFWNPYIESQAVDRAHRIGQARDVTVHRILARETVEDKILEIQERKRSLIDAAMDQTAFRASTRLTAGDLAAFFQ